MRYKAYVIFFAIIACSLLMINNSFGLPSGYNLNIIINGNGTVEKNPDKTYYDEYNLETVTLTAVPDKGWKFIRWEGDLTGSDNPDTIYMDYHKTVTAVFEKLPNTATNLLILDNE